MGITDLFSWISGGASRSEARKSTVSIIDSTKRIKSAGDRAQAMQCDMITGLYGDALDIIGENHKRKDDSRGGKVGSGG